MNLLADLRRRWRLQRDAIAARVAVKQDILSDRRFRHGLDALAGGLGLDPVSSVEKASRYLDELVTAHSDAVPDFSLVLSRIADRRGFEGVLDYDDSALNRLQNLDEEHTLVVTTADRSYLDFLVRVPFARRGFDREYRFAGANILFWPMGPIGHSFGIIYIRRGFRDPLYTFVVRHYVGWLTEQQANFMWALEGGRTRTGKLLRPKGGLLAYVADAYVDGRASEIILVPTTVVYEYLDEIFEFADYGRGAAKAGESLVFMVRFAQRQRRVPPEAKIFVSFGEPVSLGEFLHRVPARDDDGFATGITRAALEVSRRIEAATPITAVALVLLPLLERQGVRMTVDELAGDLAPTLRYIARKELPAVEPAAGDARGVRRALGLLEAQGLVTVDGQGVSALYTVTAGRHIEASYYRNGVVHHFVIPSLIEVAAIRCAAAELGGRVEAYWTELERLRDLLDLEFFFPEGDAFAAAIREELERHDDRWEATLGSPGGIDAIVDGLQPFFAPRVLAPFLEAYAIVADGLRRLGSQPVVDERHFLLDCSARAQLELELGRLQRPDAASLNLFDVPLTVAQARGLLFDPPGDGRDVFASTIREYLGAISALESRDCVVPTADRKTERSGA